MDTADEVMAWVNAVHIGRGAGHVPTPIEVLVAEVERLRAEVKRLSPPHLKPEQLSGHAAGG